MAANPFDVADVLLMRAHQSRVVFLLPRPVAGLVRRKIRDLAWFNAKLRAAIGVRQSMGWRGFFLAMRVPDEKLGRRIG